MNENIIQTVNAGMILNNLRFQNAGKKLALLSSMYFKEDRVITYPEIVKNASTPRYPLLKIDSLRWKANTAITLAPLIASISARLFSIDLQGDALIISQEP